MNGVEHSELQMLVSHIAELTTKVAVLVEKVDEVRLTQSDHEKRLRASEKWRYSVPAALLISAGTAFIAIWRPL